jgi:hypothetical protein
MALGKSLRPYLENKLKQKRAGSVVQVVEHLPSRLKALRSNCQRKKKKKRKNIGHRTRKNV